jgi:hypothetical protein
MSHTIGENMTRDATRRFGLLLVSSLVLMGAVACGGLTLPGQSAATSPSGPSSSAVGGVGGAADLEALLPSQLCGQPSKKQSFGGTANIPDASNNPYAALFAGLGSGGVAIAEPASTDTCKVSAAAFRLQGANQLIIQAFLAAAANDSGGQSSQVNLGGKAATKVDDAGDVLYIYVKGDTIFVVGAPSDDLATPVLAGLP